MARPSCNCFSIQRALISEKLKDQAAKVYLQDSDIGNHGREQAKCLVCSKRLIYVSLEAQCGVAHVLPHLLPHLMFHQYPNAAKDEAVLDNRQLLQITGRLAQQHYNGR